MQNVLVTGAVGFIGSHVIHELLKTNKYFIVGIDNINNFYSINIKHQNNLQNIKSSNYRFILQGILNEDAISKLFKEYNFDIVLHFAAQPGVSYSVKHPDEVKNINVNGFDIVCRVASKFKTKHFIFASSSSIYGDNGIPKSLYAETKKINELHAYEFSKEYPDTKYTGLRFFTVYGKNMRPDLGMYKFIDAMYKNQEIHIYGDGEQTRDFTYIDDVVNGVISIMESDKEWKCEMFDLGNGTPISINKLLELLKEKINPNFNKIIYEGKKSYDATNTCANPSKMKEFTGFTPKYTIYEGINKYLDLYGNNTTCIFTIIKNEHEYLDDFIKYHLSIGINHIFVFEDYGTKTHKEITDKYKDVTLFSVDEIKKVSEEAEKIINKKILNKNVLQPVFMKYGILYIKQNYNYNWCFAIDIDEYITCNGNVNTMMQHYHLYDGILLQWENFGASGHIYKPDYTDKSLTEIYTTPVYLGDKNEIPATKKIVYNLYTYKLEFFSCQHDINRQLTIYCNSDFSQKYKGQIYDNIYLRHYITKSFEEYFWKLKIRGMFYKKHRDLNDFFLMNTDLANQKEDIIKLFNQ